MYRTLVDEYGANPWSPNIHGDTPLLLACRRSLNMAQVKILSRYYGHAHHDHALLCAIWGACGDTVALFAMATLYDAHHGAAGGDDRVAADGMELRVGHVRTPRCTRCTHCTTSRGWLQPRVPQAATPCTPLYGRCVRYPLYELEGEGYGARRKHQDGALSTGSERLSEGSSVMREVSQPLRGRQGQRQMNMNVNRQSVLSVVTKERVASLLYSDVLWKLIQDKWHVFGRPRFAWFAAVSLICQMLLTLSLCRRPVLEDAPWSLQPGDKCEGVLVVLIVPISMEIPTRVASWCFSASLALNAVLLLRLLFAMSRLGTNTRSGLSRQACATLLLLYLRRCSVTTTLLTNI